MNLIEKLGITSPIEGVSTGLTWWTGTGNQLDITSPVDGKLIGSVNEGSEEDYHMVVASGQSAFLEWRKLPAPHRGEIVRQIGDRLRLHKDDLGALVSYEMGKSLQEGLGEVQEMIDICDFAVGMSRQLYGLSMHSERPNHRMMEQWHPLGIVGIISAFNFPVAVWAWNAMIAWICGDVCVWKPSEKTPFTGIACQKIILDVFKENNVPEGVSGLIIGGRDIGKLMAEDPRIALISATGSTRMGKSVGAAVGARLGKSILELGGNNAIIVSDQADLKVVIPAVVFGAVGTAGQRCTSTRRLIIHESIYDNVVETLVSAYGQIRIGDPLDANNHMGPLIDQDAVHQYNSTIAEAQDQGGALLVGGDILSGAGYESGCYVAPAIISATTDMKIVHHETFAPILYVMKYSTLDEAIAIQNSVPQGLSSSIFTLNMRESEAFLSNQGSDCGIANVNIGTSGAEIGGAFGGEKETGGGRESGSDAWKAYMRRQTCTTNYSAELPLAQGIKFEL
ncbi:MAG: aldehyde dehydrogenase (NAD+) [Saprospiraceae bacterium]|jgi:aldehyde dehydrogenase (NAD+)